MAGITEIRSDDTDWVHKPQDSKQSKLQQKFWFHKRQKFLDLLNDYQLLRNESDR